jgi:hypothetical protein
MDNVGVRQYYIPAISVVRLIGPALTAARAIREIIVRLLVTQRR